MAEKRKTAVEVLEEVRSIFNTSVVEAGGEPLSGSSPVYLVAWKHWEPMYERAAEKESELVLKAWVFNYECVKACKRLVSECLTAYVGK